MIQFNIYEDLEKVNNDSMLFDNGDEIASLRIGKFVLSVVVRGSKKVYFKNNCYTYTQDFPKELVDYFMGKKVDFNIEEDLFIDDNNWYELEFGVIEDEKNKILNTDFVVNDYIDVFDLEGSLTDNKLSKSTMLYKILLEEFKSIKDLWQNEVEILKELNFENL